MTSLSLSLWIAAGIVLQLVIGLGIGFWRHLRNYRSLRGIQGVAESPATHVGSMAAEEVNSPGWQGFRTFRVENKVFEDAHQSVCSFYLVPGDGKSLPRFLPGQFLTFRLDIPESNGRIGQMVRCYSLSDAPDSDAYRVTIKRVAPPAGSDLPPGRASNFFHDHVAVGSELQVRAPAGHFHLDEGDAPAVLIGSGIGITPMLSMLNWSMAQRNSREIWLYYGVRDGRELIMKPHLDALAAAHPNFHLRVCFSNPQPDDMLGRDYHCRGRIDVGLLRMQLPLRPYHFYVCGPTPMMESLVPALEDWGVPDERIHLEAFGPASIRHKPVPGAESPSESAATGIVVNFSLSGKQIPWTLAAGNLLELAEANGIPVNSGCRAGGCGSCQTTIQSGEVAYRQTPDFDPEPGSCLLCVCTPKTSVTLEA